LRSRLDDAENGRLGSIADTRPEKGEHMTLLVLAAALAALVGFVSPTHALTPVTTVPLGTAAHDMKVVGTLAYVATDAGMTVLDVSNPAAPFVRGSFATPQPCQGIDVGAHAYLACETAGLFIVNISNPDAPSLLGRFTMSGPAWDVAVKGNVVYVANYNGELYAVSVSNPRAPTKVAVRGLIAWHSASQDLTLTAKLRAHVPAGAAKATSVAISGNLLVTNDWNYGRLYAYDITVPTNPVFKGTHYVPFVLGVELDPDRNVVYMLGAYGRFSGIYTLPISLLNPMLPTRYTTCAPCKFLRSRTNIDHGGVAKSPGSERLFYMSGRGEFHVLAADLQGTLVEEAFEDLGPTNLGLAETMGAATVGDHVYVTAGTQGVRVFTLP
jgi:hypothetical protein